MVWLLSLRKADGSSPGYSTFNSHRAALFNLYRDYNQRMRSERSDELVTLFKGLKRDIAWQLAGGHGREKTGKDGLNFSFYRFLGKEFLSSARFDYLFAHCFMVYCWNLISHAGNMVAVCFTYLQWRKDALGVYFGMINVEKDPATPRHIYANPWMSEFCPILAIALCLLCVPIGIDEAHQKLFPGSNQYDRFRRVLVRLSESNNGKLELETLGMHVDDFGTH